MLRTIYLYELKKLFRARVNMIALTGAVLMLLFLVVFSISEVQPVSRDAAKELDGRTIDGELIEEMKPAMRVENGSTLMESTTESDKYVPVPGKPIVYDLYTGTGTIALFLASMASKVVGIEYVPEAIEDARANAALNGIANAVFFAGDMKDVLNSSFIAENGTPSIVILDPPRAGIHPDVARVLMAASPARIIYVSCNPASQARDLAVFADKYDVLSVQPVDMFPKTHHIENVAFLALRQDPIV